MGSCHTFIAAQNSYIRETIKKKKHLVFFQIYMDLGSDIKQIDVTQSRFFIGRSEDCTIRIEHESISDTHAEVYYEDDIVYIIDNSVSGIYVNDQKIPNGQAYKIGPQDAIRIGDHECVFKLNLRTLKGVLLP